MGRVINYFVLYMICCFFLAATQAFSFIFNNLTLVYIFIFLVH